MAISSTEFHDIVSGKRRDLTAAVSRAILRLASIPYGASVRRRNRRFDRGKRPVFQAACPVVSVGNITLGGAGKTPMVEWLARWLRARRVRVAILSRGYGAEKGAVNDEALELEERLPDVPHLQNRDRVASAQIAVEELASQFLLLDDGFQHRGLARDLDLVLIDALSPFGYGRLFPGGALREPLSGLSRADVIGLSRADAVTAKERQAIRDKVARHAPNADWIELSHRPLELICWRGKPQPLAAFAGRRVAAFCGIGNPDGFLHTLTSSGFEVAGFRTFPDHHPYGKQDVALLEAWGKSLPADTACLLCTHKDLVKLQTRQLGGRPLFALKIGIEITQGQELLEKRLQALLPTGSP